MSGSPIDQVVNRLRIEGAVQRIDWELDGRVPRARRRQIREELRAHLASASESEGAAEAVRQLGDLRRLASEYLETEQGRVNVRAGTYAAIVTLAVIEVLNIAVFLAFKAGVDAAGGAGQYAYAYGPFAGTVSGAVHTNGSLMFSVSAFSLPDVLFMLAAFLIWCRAWRLFQPKGDVKGYSSGRVGGIWG